MLKSLAKHLFRWPLGAGFGGVLADLLLGELAAKKAKRGETDDCEDNMSRNTQIDLNLLVHFTMLMDLSPRHSMFAVVIPVSRISGGTRMSSTKDELIAALLNRDD